MKKLKRFTPFLAALGFIIVFLAARALVHQSQARARARPARSAAVNRLGEASVTIVSTATNPPVPAQ